jgi:16S rRNA processing protein RimM
MEKEDCFLLGRIRKTSGFQGELILDVRNFSVDVVTSLEYFWLDTEDGLIPYYSEYIEAKSESTVALRFLDAPVLAKAKLLCGLDVYLSRDLLPEAEEEEFVPGDLVGFDVTDKLHGSLGKVEELIEFREQSLIRIGSGKKEILIPLVKELITKVDIKKRRITVHLPDGLINLNQ